MSNYYKTLMVSIVAQLCLNSAGAQLVNSNGNMYVGYTDIAFPGTGWTIERVYNSKGIEYGLFGGGWNCEYDGYVMVVPGKAVCFFASGGIQQQLFQGTGLDSADITYCVDKMVTLAKNQGKFADPQALSAYRSKMLKQERTRNDSWAALVTKGKIEPLHLNAGTELTYQGCKVCGTMVLGDAREFMRVTDSGYFIRSGERTYEFNRSGKMTLLKEQCFIQHISYDSTGGITHIQDEKGNAVDITRNEYGNIIQLRSNTGSISRFTYNDYRFLTAMMSGDDISYTYTYDDRINMTSIGYANHTQTVMEYASQEKFDNVNSMVKWDGSRIDFKYALDGVNETFTSRETDSHGKPVKAFSLRVPDPTHPREAPYFDRVVITDRDTTTTTFDGKTDNPVACRKNGTTYHFVYDSRNFVTRVYGDAGFSVQVEYVPGTQKIQALQSGRLRFALQYDDECGFAGFDLPSGKRVRIPTEAQDAKEEEAAYQVLDKCLKVLALTYLNGQLDRLNGKSQPEYGLTYFKNLIASDDASALWEYAGVYLYSDAKEKARRSAYLENARALLEKFIRAAKPDDDRLGQAHNKLAYIELLSGKYAAAENWLKESRRTRPASKEDQRYLPLVYLLNNDMKTAREIYDRNKQTKWTYFLSGGERDAMREGTFRELYLKDLRTLENDSILNDNIEVARKYLFTPKEYIRYYITKSQEEASATQRQLCLSRAEALSKSDTGSRVERNILLFRIYGLKDKTHRWELINDADDLPSLLAYAGFSKEEGIYEPEASLRKDYFRNALQLYRRGYAKDHSAKTLTQVYDVSERLSLPIDTTGFLSMNDPRSLLTCLDFFSSRLGRKGIPDSIYAGHSRAIITRLWPVREALNGSKDAMNLLAKDVYLTLKSDGINDESLTDLWLKYAQLKETIALMEPRQADDLNSSAIGYYNLAEAYFGKGAYGQGVEYMTKAREIGTMAVSMSPNDSLLRDNLRDYIHNLGVYHLYNRNFQVAEQVALESSQLKGNNSGYKNTLLIRVYLFNSKYDRAVALYDAIRDQPIAAGNNETYRAALQRQLDALEKAGLINDNVNKFRQHMNEQ